MKENQDWSDTETTLQKRIEIHDKYSKYEINDWILSKLKLKPGEKILDIGCGNGKQAISYSKVVGQSGKVYGIDISQDLLDQAKEKSSTESLKIIFINHDANNPLPFEDKKFDVISCCFSIYYYSDVEKTLSEMKRVLRRGGRIFIAGPTVENAHEMLAVYAKIMGNNISQIREERMRDEIIPLIKKTFSNVSVDIFENPIEFPDSETFLHYFSSTLLLKESSQNPQDMKKKIDSIKGEIDEIIQTNKKFTVTKYVYGISGFKENHS